MNMLITLALRYLSGRKLRTFLTTLAITFGVLVIFGMNSLLPAFMDVFQAHAMAVAGEVDASITSKTGEAFPQELVARVAAVEGVRAASGRLERLVNLPADAIDHDPAMPDRITAVKLVGVDPESIRSLRAFQILEGRFLESGDGAAAVISSSLAEEAGLGVGDAFSLPTAIGVRDLTIVGLLPQRFLPGDEEVLVTLTQAQSLFTAPGQINTIDVAFNTLEEDRRKEIEQAIISMLGESFSVGVLQAGAEILNNIRTAQMIFSLLGVLSLLMGGFIIFNTFRTIVAERRRDIGMLRAIGASRRTITGMVLVEGAIQGVVGSVTGLLLGYLLSWLLLVAISPVLQQFMNMQAKSIPFLPGLAGVSILAGLGITLLAGLLPARAASRVTPLEALRPSLGAVNIRRMAGLGFWAGVVLLALAVLALLPGDPGLVGLGGLLFVAGLLLVGPALVNPIANLFGRFLALVIARNGTAELAEGNLSRQPSRAAVTASTTMIALAILIMAASITSSVTLSFKEMLRKSLSSDFLIIPPTLATWGMNVGASPELSEKIRALDGVQVVSTLRFAGTQVNGVAVGLIGIQPQDYKQTGGLTFIEGDPQAAFAAVQESRGMIVNGIMATNTGVKLGDTITVLTPTGAATYTVVAIASDYLNAKTTTGYISQANIAADFGRQEDVFYQINLKPGSDAAAVEAELKRLLKPYPQFKLVVGQEFYTQNAQLVDQVFLGMYALVLFLAIPSLIAMVNTLAIGVIERRREIGMLRAVGATRRQVSTVILTEALILAAIGTAFGLLSGLYLGYMAVGAFSSIGFPLKYIFPANGLVLALAAGLLFGALAAIIPARQAAGMEIVAALRYE